MLRYTASFLLLSALSASLHAATPEQVEFFESRIRPILAQECYECHSEATKQKGGLVLDSRPGWQKGGDSGDVLKPGDPANSLLMTSIRHEGEEDLHMPKNGAKLDAKVLADFERWIREGAVDPRDQAPSKEQIAKETDWSAVLQRRKDWWAFKPLAQSTSLKSIDEFIDAALAKEGISPAPRADEETLKRRVSFVLTGLPPQKSESTDLKSEIEVLLNSPHFGEKWARHMMDWVRYAESYGSEGDPAIPYASRYRDYLIRAFNEDVKWPQLIQEAIAGDLLPQPRLRDGINESAIGIAQLRMVLHGFSPVDSLDEMVTFTDNQIDTVTKAFQALTVSCARCHNHKFDPISQTDFYALYGIFTSTHPAVIDARAPGEGDDIRAQLTALKKQIKAALLNDTTSGEPKSADETDLKWFGMQRTAAGEFSVTEKGLRIHPAGFVSDTLSTKERAVVFSERFKCEGGTLWFRVAGNGGVKAKYVVQNYPRTGTIHKAVELKDAKDEKLAWRSLDLEFWKGDEIFLQVATAADMPAEHKADERSWFVLADARITKDGKAPPEPEASKATPEQLFARWKANTLSSADAEALNAHLQKQKLPEKVLALLKKYREVEQTLPMPVRVPGVIEADAKDAPLFTRGDHKMPAEMVKRRFFDALDPAPFQTKQSGRLELAERMADMKNNPLTARVIVNRVWHHVFGRGIVASTDNFGKLGDLPTHPELLDHLASEFIASGGSIKGLLRSILNSKTFQRASEMSDVRSQKSDLLLAHWPVRRLEAEAVRDSILTLTGKLDAKLFGESVGSGDERRSVYVKVIRNALDPFLTTFDAPVPFSTRGNRDSTNVPAQSLTLLNDPNVIGWARDWALRMLKAGDDAARVRQMFREAFFREASAEEVTQSLAYLKGIEAENAAQGRELAEAREKLAQTNQSIAAIFEPARAKLLQQRPAMPAAGSLPEPLAEWLFESGLKDEKGKLDLKPVGDAHVENGALVLNGGSMAQSGSLPKTLRAKTFEAWVMLDDLKQQGGGVLTVQGKDGVLFDSLVFGEKQAGHWVAGSNFFERSELFEGSEEKEAASRPVHMAIVYQPDGSVSGYRDGKPYGRTYRKAPGAIFEAEASEVLLGCRHGSPSGNRGLRGRIFRARLYDRALTQPEIAQTAKFEAGTITEADLLAALSHEQRAEVQRLQGQRDQLTRDLPSAPPEDARVLAWTSLAQSLLNLKEFIYLR